MRWIPYCPYRDLNSKLLDHVHVSVALQLIVAPDHFWKVTTSWHEPIHLRNYLLKYDKAF